MTHTVAVLGGGIGGLTAAQELAERGFAVTVYEALGEFGGKARSMDVPGSGTQGRKNLPGEHGFRFFPGFYWHVIDTMSRIPRPEGTVADHLVPATGILMARADGRNELIAPAQRPDALSDIAVLLQFLWDFGTQIKIAPWELASLSERLLTLLCSCDERRYEQWETYSWWDFCDADNRSADFQKFLGDGLTRTLVAAQGRLMSARTGGLIVTQLILDIMGRSRDIDRVLDGPTSEVWIDPWVDRLADLDVKFVPYSTVTEILCANGEVTGVRMLGRDEPVVAELYVSALPGEKLARLLTPELLRAEPRLQGVRNLHYGWMNGALYYLNKDVPLQRGHAIFIDSEWALTAISQAQFWPDVDLEQRGDGHVDGILSVDISDWDTPSRRTGLTARQCTEEQILDEVWNQLTDHIDDGSLKAENVLHRFLDPAIGFPAPGQVTNSEPLLVNTVNSWRDRPDARTAIPNLVLAADYVRTHTDLATMESANEAARRAVNALLDRVGSTATRCEVRPLHEPAALAPLRALDKVAWELQRPVRTAMTALPGGSRLARALRLA
ncbi:hydroxysqualene dehydroxylase [Mycobacterium sp. SMC-4]|uniref:hydroxysqualene dehydroxylase n=1 Tax=Mycobacterium sp. SMC-4 TaxID=2857059 RepID=UPI003D00274F